MLQVGKDLSIVKTFEEHVIIVTSKSGQRDIRRENSGKHMNWQDVLKYSVTGDFLQKQAIL